VRCAWLGKAVGVMDLTAMMPVRSVERIEMLTRERGWRQADLAACSELHRWRRSGCSKSTADDEHELPVCIYKHFADRI
jgi:hypothetical protein